MILIERELEERAVSSMPDIRIEGVSERRIGMRTVPFTGPIVDLASWKSLAYLDRTCVLLCEF